MTDNGYTPHLVVDARHKGVHVPPQHVQDGKIVLNVSHTATRGISLGNELVTFEARFGGVSQRLEIPLDAVLGIYARETGQGMIFGEDGAPPDGSPPLAPTGGTPAAGAARKSPKLKVVK